jgi:hypothetical protein
MVRMTLWLARDGMQAALARPKGHAATLTSPSQSPHRERAVTTGRGLTRARRPVHRLCTCSTQQLHLAQRACDPSRP